VNINKLYINVCLKSPLNKIACLLTKRHFLILIVNSYNVFSNIIQTKEERMYMLIPKRIVDHILCERQRYLYEVFHWLKKDICLLQETHLQACKNKI